MEKKKGRRNRKSGMKQIRQERTEAERGNVSVIIKKNNYNKEL